MSQPNQPVAPSGLGEHAVVEGHIEESLASVREALTGLRYGNVSLTIHEGRVVQIDVTEKRRLKPN